MNSNSSLLSDEEYGKQKSQLLREKTRFEEMLNDALGQIERWR